MDALQTFLAQFPTELFFVFAVWLVAAAFSFKLGSSQVGAGTAGLVIAGLLFPHLALAWPFVSGGAQGGWASSTITFALLALVLMFLMRRFAGDAYMDSGRIGASVISGAALTAVLLALWANLPALYLFYAFPTILAPYFAVPYFFWWIVGPLAAASIVGGHSRW